MADEAQKNLVQRAKDLLQIDGECSIFELNDHLREYRNEKHPDKFQDDELKKKAEVCFKEAQSLLDEFEKQIQLDRFNRKPAEMVVYKPLYDAVQLRNDLDKLKKETEALQGELKSEQETNADLRKKLVEKEDSSLKQEIEHLKSLYKPSAQKYASLGLGIVLTGALAVMSQMEAVSDVVKKYSPFGEKYTSTTLFVCLLLFLAVTLRKLWEHGYIRWKSEAVCSPRYAACFMEFLKHTKDEPIMDFSEIESFNFIAGNPHPLKRFTRMFGFKIFREDTISQLNEIFLHNMLNKRLIEISRASGFQRLFSIRSERSTYEVYREYFEKKAKEKTD